jgi:hypothetical protein
VAIATIIVRLALWHFHRATLTWAEVWITLLTIAGSYGIVVLGASAVNLFRAPGLLDKERADEITALTAKLTTDQASHKQRETRITFSDLMEEGENIKQRIRTNQTAPELTAITQQLSDWIKRTHSAFIESDMQTDASTFVHSGEILSAEKIKTYIPSYIQTQTWKHYDLARIEVYLAKLQDIVERRGL